MHSLIVDWLSARAKARLQEVQDALQTQNGLGTQPPVTAFLLRDHERAALPGSQPGTPEQIFVSDDPDDPQMGVFIARETLERVAQTQLSLHNLHDYCVVAEGVSHFLYLAHAERPVSLLELELQAEVDKFVHLTAKLALTPGSPKQRSLHDALFERYALHPHLDAAEVERYDTATRHAARFCYRISQNARRFYSDARDFFAFSLEQKLRA